MGEIKFIARDKGKQRWLGVFALAYIAMLGQSYFDEDVIWVKYTGLKDKNGKEIYEGDIVYSFYFQEQKGEVKQHESGEWYLDYDDAGTDSLLSELNRYAGNVIGNIHETPELLEE